MGVSNRRLSGLPRPRGSISSFARRERLGCPVLALPSAAGSPVETDTRKLSDSTAVVSIYVSDHWRYTNIDQNIQRSIVYHQFRAYIQSIGGLLLIYTTGQWALCGTLPEQVFRSTALKAPSNGVPYKRYVGKICCECLYTRGIYLNDSPR